MKKNLKNVIINQDGSIIEQVKELDGYYDRRFAWADLHDGSKIFVDHACELVHDEIGTVIIQDYTLPRYEFIGEFHEGLARVCNSEDRWGYIDRTGKEVIPCVYYLAEDFSEGFGLVDGGQWMFLDKNGNVTIKCSQNYTKVYSFHSGRARVIKYGSLYGYIDQVGKEVIPCELYKAEDFDRGFATVDMRATHVVARRGVVHIGVPTPRIWVIDVDGNRYFPNEAKRLKKTSTTRKRPSDEKEWSIFQKKCVDYYSEITLLGETFCLTSETKLGLIEKKKKLIENIRTLINCLEKDVVENAQSDGYQKTYNRPHKAKTNE